MEKQYNPNQIESKWQKIWAKNKTFEVDIEKAKKPYYNLMMFPYPSAEGLHIGNVYAFTGSDIWGRFMAMQGYDVFEPIGLDGFGIHSENYALKVGQHPAKQAKISEKNFYRQLKTIGNRFCWDHHLETYDSEYYHWTQWIFIQLFKAGLAYRKKSAVNWCPSCKTVLADEQVIKKIKNQKSLAKPDPALREKIKIEKNVCERCESEVEQKDLEQWFFRITDFADRLLKNTQKIDWSEKVLIAQRNWIGKKEGLNITYPVMEADQRPVLVKGRPLTITCFTTRPDTNFGATFVVLAPEHPRLYQTTSNNNKKAVSSYKAQALKKSKEERIADASSKTGVFTGRYCFNQLTQKLMPIWVSDFVLVEFGTGAVVGVPGHDKRDFEFAREFHLPIVRVVAGKDGDRSAITKLNQVQEENGKMINSGFLNGMDIHEATKKMIIYFEKQGWGKRTVTYHLRDWLISRQRYWGPPIPMVYCQACAKKGVSGFTETNPGVGEFRAKRGRKTPGLIKTDLMPGWYPISESDLPVLLPEVKDWRPKGTGRGPLAQLKDWVKVKCPKCGGPAERETDVSDTFLDSAWYFLRYPSSPTPGLGSAKDTSEVKSSNTSEVEDTKKAWDREITKRWLPVDMYIGGAEHSVLHLLYSRFLTMFFKDKGLLEFEEPFTKFRAHGLIIKGGTKMSKSKGNIVNPDTYIAKFGADALRCYLMFIGPLSQGGDFRDTGMQGMHKFLARVWRLCQEKSKISNPGVEEFRAERERKTPGLNQNVGANPCVRPNEATKTNELYWQHQTIKRVTAGIKRLKYNTAIAALMEYVNFLEKHPQISQKSKEILILLLAPFAPHVTEELWEKMQSTKDIQKTKKTCAVGDVGANPCVRPLKYHSVHHQPWPACDEKYLKQETIEIVVQINGKVRDRLQVSHAKATSQTIISNLAHASAKIKPFFEGKKIKKEIFIKGKLINFVV